ncbi:hypothetical protein L1049_005202 [Liquidambar formosana]|uniref:Uncharacterized protein n=1 Tax=Liquidambar formosana TaxID=63359 RepID=A0AAP0RQ90_LIQFO
MDEKTEEKVPGNATIIGGYSIFKAMGHDGEKKIRWKRKNHVWQQIGVVLSKSQAQNRIYQLFLPDFSEFNSFGPKGSYIPSFWSMSTAASVCAKNKEKLKLLVTAGPHAQKMVQMWLFGLAAWEPASEYVQPRVSLYRLTAHLTSAFVIYCGLFWIALSVVMPEQAADSVAWIRGAAKVERLTLPLSFIVGIMAVSGAFVAGNDAGHAYNTFPKMGDMWIPDDVFCMKPLIRNFFENTSTVQTLYPCNCNLNLNWQFVTVNKKLDIHPAVRFLIGSTISTVSMAALQVTFRDINTSILCTCFTWLCTSQPLWKIIHCRSVNRLKLKPLEWFCLLQLLPLDPKR